jgi:quinolinate synthase
MTTYGPSRDGRLIERIEALKHQRRAIIMAHNYQTGEVQDIADFVGDSLALARRAAEVREADAIVLCGVQFMAETAKLVNPQRTVLMPDENAGCPMANMITPRELAEARARHPGATVVCYVNSSAEVKAASDICCTSANAEKVVATIPPEAPVIFVPDQSLGDYVSRRLGRELILWPGYCPTHHRILADDIERRRREHPEAVVMVHPECTRDVVAMADFVGSTSQMLRFVAASDAEAFIIGTEIGICHTLRKQNPGKQIIPVSPLADCPNMKLTTVEKILWSLEELKFEVTIPDQVAEGAQQAIERMLEVS